MGMYGNCAKKGCTEKLHGMNSKPCKLCNQQVCLDHLQYEKHDCIKTIYEPYIRKSKIRDTGVNLSTGLFMIICETCGYVSDYPKLIENAGSELKSHLDTNQECKKNKRTFLEILNEPIEESKVHSSVIRDPDRKLWVCGHCRPPRKFTDHDAYLNHHFIHS